MFELQYLSLGSITAGIAFCIVHVFPITRAVGNVTSSVPLRLLLSVVMAGDLHAISVLLIR
jgi:hypothetical protein